MSSRAIPVECNQAKRQMPMNCGLLKLEHPLGKGEVVSSILTGSTKNPYDSWGYMHIAEAFSAVSGRTQREPRKSIRGKSVESVRALFGARAAQPGYVA